VETLGRILPGTGCRPITMVPKPKFTLTKKITVSSIILPKATARVEKKW
jgi:hypothetical protein